MKQLIINYHVTESCNYNCNYCFAHWSHDKPRYKEELWRDPQKLKKLLSELLKMPEIVPGDWLKKPRLNLAGGEPMLLERNGNLSKILSYAYSLGFDLSIITNGSLMEDDFIQKWAPYFHTIGISFDSKDIDTNAKIGRCSKKEDTISSERIVEIFRLARKYNPKIVRKINTVVNSVNHGENFVDLINEISPDRWKILRMLPLADSQEIKNRQGGMEITNKQWNSFLSRHKKHVTCPCVPEDNDAMTASYIMVNPNGNFYSNTLEHDSQHIISDNICEVGVQKAYKSLDDEAPLSSEKYNMRYNYTLIAPIK